MAHNNDSVRNKLIEITDKGLMLKAVALNVGIDVNNLSRFKSGMNCLKESDIEILSEYLKAVVIPQWNTIVQDKTITARERFLASRNKSEMTMRERLLESRYRNEEEKKTYTKLDALCNLMKK